MQNSNDQLLSIQSLYPELPLKRAIPEAYADGIITLAEAQQLAGTLPKPMSDTPPIEEPKPRETQYNLKDLRLIWCPWSGKQFADMTNDEIDANVDAYNPELREKALAYLKMRGYS